MKSRLTRPQLRRDAPPDVAGIPPAQAIGRSAGRWAAVRRNISIRRGSAPLHKGAPAFGAFGRIPSGGVAVGREGPTTHAKCIITGSGWLPREVELPPSGRSTWTGRAAGSTPKPGWASHSRRQEQYGGAGHGKVSPMPLRGKVLPELPCPSGGEPAAVAQPGLPGALRGRRPKSRPAPLP